MIGCHALLEKHIDKLPMTSGILEEVCETDEAFRKKRVKKVIDLMLEEGEMIVEWKVLRR